MTIVLTVLLAVLKFVGWLLLFLLALLVVLLILPVELRFAYLPGEPILTAWYGPLHFRLWPRPSAGSASATQSPQSTAQQSTSGSAAPAQPALPMAAAAAESSTKQTSTLPVQTSTPAGSLSGPAPAVEPAKEQGNSGGLPFHISERIEAAIDLLAHDPTAFARCMFGHLRWVGRFLARHIKVQHLTVFWTVTGEDAAQTAALYGTAMTAANNLLAFLQQVIRLQCDHLQLEPDFTGQRMAERRISGRLHTHPFLLLWLLLRLLFRLGKDPQLQPAHTN